MSDIGMIRGYIFRIFRKLKNIIKFFKIVLDNYLKIEYYTNTNKKETVTNTDRGDLLQADKRRRGSGD